MLRVATRANAISPSATTQVTIIELVIGNPNGRAISTAFWEIACSSGFAGAAGPADCVCSWPAVGREPADTVAADNSDRTNAGLAKAARTRTAGSLRHARLAVRLRS